MNAKQAEQFIVSLSNIGRKEYLSDKKNCSLYLKRLQFFLDLIGNPEKKIPHYIHVTGTSGKGSVCLMLDSILRASGKKVGTLTSPHASVIQERWTVNGRMMSGKDFAKVVTEIKPKFDEYIRKSPYDMVSYFEIMTAIALYFFAKQKVDWAILEVGMGGRYDSTNIIPYKDIAVITNIGLDHTDVLGDTKEKIAYEKAGIIKPGCTVFTSEKDKKVLSVIEEECKKDKVKFQISLPRRQAGDFRFQNIQSSILNLKSTISGRHQLSNAQLCTDIAQYLKIPNKAITAGLKRVKLPLRMEIVSKNPTIILDGAHNPDKMKTTISSINNLKSSILNLHLIIGFSADKDTKQMIRQLATLKPQSIACTRQTQNTFRKVANPGTIAAQFKKLLPKTKIEVFLDPIDALNWSLKNESARRNLAPHGARASDTILVTGSIFLSGEIRPLL